MTNLARAHQSLGFVVLGLGLLMFFLAGLGTFGEGWDAHRATGMGLILLALVLVVLAALGRREALRASAILLALLVVQSLLAVAGREDLAIVGALHPLNALLILFVAHQAARGLPLSMRGAR
jgi:hypothetical protein